MTKNADGTNKLIGPGEKSLISTDKCFWKEPEDIKSSGVKTRSQTINQPAVSNRDYNHYIKNKERRETFGKIQ